MPLILRNLPYFDEPTSVEVRGQSLSVKRDQIVLWISIAEKGLPKWDSRIPKFPAILDPGCNHNLLVNERQLANWAGIHPGYLPKLTSIRVAGQSVSQLAANVWLHPNVRGRATSIRPSRRFESKTRAGHCRLSGDRRPAASPSSAAVGASCVPRRRPANRHRLPSLTRRRPHAVPVLVFRLTEQTVALSAQTRRSCILLSCETSPVDRLFISRRRNRLTIFP